MRFVGSGQSPSVRSRLAIRDGRGFECRLDPLLAISPSRSAHAPTTLLIHVGGIPRTARSLARRAPPRSRLSAAGITRRVAIQRRNFSASPSGRRCVDAAVGAAGDQTGGLAGGAIASLGARWASEGRGVMTRFQEVCCQHNTTSASGASAEAELAARIGDRPSVQALAAAPRRPHRASTTPGCGAAPSRRSTSADGLLRVIVGTDPIVSYPAPPAAPTLANAARETSSCRRVSRAALTSPGLVVR